MANPTVPQSLMTKHQVNVLGLPRKNCFRTFLNGDFQMGAIVLYESYRMIVFMSGEVESDIELRIHTSFVLMIFQKFN